jgi:hypothetical protein
MMPVLPRPNLHPSPHPPTCCLPRYHCHSGPFNEPTLEALLGLEGHEAHGLLEALAIKHLVQALPTDKDSFRITPLVQDVAR